MSQTPTPDPWGTPPRTGTEEGSQADQGGFRSPPPPSFQPPPPRDPVAQSQPPQEPPGQQPPPNYPPPNYPPPNYPPPNYPPPPGSGYPPPGYPPPGGYQSAPGGYPPPGGYQPYGTGLPTPPPVGSFASRAGTLAGWWVRVGATVIDGLVFVIPSIIFDLALGRTGGDIVVWILYAAYLIVLIGLRGQTVGNMAVNSRTVDAISGGIPGYGKAAIRWLVLFVLNITVIGGIINVLWPLWDSRNQTLHDKAAGTLVVRT